MSKGKNQHLVPHPDGWAIKGEKNDRYTAITDTKAEADRIGREIARNQQSEFVIHGKDGKIQDKDSFGGDTNPPKDKRH
jgi:hypothetical protein